MVFSYPSKNKGGACNTTTTTPGRGTRKRREGVGQVGSRVEYPANCRYTGWVEHKTADSNSTLAWIMWVGTMVWYQSLASQPNYCIYDCRI